MRTISTSLPTLLILLSIPAIAAAGPWPVISEPREVGGGEADAALVAAAERYVFVPQVAGARKNGVAWYNYFVRGRKIPLDRVALLRDQQVTRESIQTQLRRLAAAVKPGGTLWVVFIGHGAPSKDGKDGLLLGIDTQQTADSLAARGLRRSELMKILGTSKAARRVVVLDTCFSGRTGTGKSLVPGLQPLVVGPAVPPPPPTPVVAETQIQTMLLTAAAGDEFAGALPGAARPAFSYLLLGALRGWADTDADGTVTSGEAFGYTKRALTALVTDRTQTPSFEGPSDVSLGKAWEKGPDLARLVVKLGEPAAPPKPAVPKVATNPETPDRPAPKLPAEAPKTAAASPRVPALPEKPGPTPPAQVPPLPEKTVAAPARATQPSPTRPETQEPLDGYDRPSAPHAKGPREHLKQPPPRRPTPPPPIDESRLVRVAASGAGQLDRVFVFGTGARVRRGQPLASVSNPALLQSLRQYADMVQGSSGMASSGLGMFRTMMLRNARARLISMGVSAETLSRIENGGEASAGTIVRAPVSGRLVRNNALVGSYVSPGAELFAIAPDVGSSPSETSRHVDEEPAAAPPVVSQPPPQRKRQIRKRRKRRKRRARKRRKRKRAKPGRLRISGTWRGKFSTASYSSVRAKLKLRQSGSNVVGRYTSSAGGFGIVVGRVHGKNLVLVLRSTDPNCAGSYRLVGTVSGRTFRFQLAGLDCSGVQAGRGVATRR